EEAVAAKGRVADLDDELIPVASGCGHSGGGLEVDAGRLGGFEEAIDDSGGMIGAREHAPVGFRFEGHAATLEPVDGRAGIEAVERADEWALAAGIAGREQPGVE